MRVRSTRDVAAMIRGLRAERGLSQAELARRAGVSRKWIYEFEAGKPTAELGLVIRVLERLGHELELSPGRRRRARGAALRFDYDDGYLRAAAAAGPMGGAERRARDEPHPEARGRRPGRSRPRRAPVP